MALSTKHGVEMGSEFYPLPKYESYSSGNCVDGTPPPLDSHLLHGTLTDDLIICRHIKVPSVTALEIH